MFLVSLALLEHISVELFYYLNWYLTVFLVFCFENAASKLG